MVHLCQLEDGLVDSEKGALPAQPYTNLLKTIVFEWTSNGTRGVAVSFSSFNQHCLLADLF